MATIKWIPGSFKNSGPTRTLNPTKPTQYEESSTAASLAGVPGARRISFTGKASVVTVKLNSGVNADSFARIAIQESFKVVPSVPGEAPPGALVGFLAVADAEIEQVAPWCYEPVRLPRWPWISIKKISSRATAAAYFDGCAALFDMSGNLVTELTRTMPVTDTFMAPPAIPGVNFLLSNQRSPVVQLAFNRTYALASILDIITAAGAIAVRSLHVGRTLARASIDGETNPRHGGFPIVTLTNAPVMPPLGPGGGGSNPVQPPAAGSPGD